MAGGRSGDVLTGGRFRPKRIAARALDYAAAGGNSSEAELGVLIRRFGAQAVFGRAQLRYSEMQRVLVAESVVNAYQSRQRYRDKNGSPNWAEWGALYPRLAELLVKAQLTHDRTDPD